ncbi:MAG: transcriptional regulator, PadR-like family [Frankiales bacterium]|nr:transcriptional regulator, PadR-like family [Frankiales bacterium]
MSLPHAVLGLLAVAPGTGYDLTRRFEASLSHAWHASHSQIYPELARLQGRGLVQEAGRGARGSRTWAITDQGLAELDRWLVEVQPNRSQRNETALRWFLLPLLPADQRRSALEREIADMLDSTAYLEAAAAGSGEVADDHPFRATAKLGVRINDVMLAWLREQLADT